MEILFLIIGSWIAVALTVIIGFLYLMVTTPVDSDEDRGKADLRVRDSMRGRCEKEPHIECGVTGSPGPGEETTAMDRHMI